LLTSSTNKFVKKQICFSAVFVFCCLLNVVNIYALDRFELRHAQTTIIDGVYVLSTDIDYRLHPEAEQILNKGLTVKFIVQAELFRKRKFWRDKKIAFAQQTFYLQKNAITNNYFITSPSFNIQAVYSDVRDAIRSIGELSKINLIKSEHISDPTKVLARARVVVDVRHFSGAVNYLAKYWDDWRVVSEWYEWPLKL